jgi:hypothetical protein
VDERSAAPSHRLVADAIRRTIREGESAGVRDFQFMIVLYPGYEESAMPDYRFVSAPLPLDDSAPAPSHQGARDAE